MLVRANLDAALAELPGDNTDPEYVVRSMRDFFGELFTDADEKKVRELVVAPSGKPSDGLTVAQLKDALTAKEIPIPEGAKKQDLADLLDGAK
ncbi:HeH/LEM domain protein [compost metagenome]